MESVLIVAVVVVIVVVVALAVALYLRRQRSAHLRERFGPEYEHEVERAGGRREAERELQAREQRREELEIRPLPAPVRERYHDQWRTAQQRFVDAPDAVVREAHMLVTDLMRDRGYPMENFEQRTADLSVDHPHVVEDYRAAHRIAAASEEGRASTEDLRQALVHYRSLFDRLLESSADTDTEVR